MDGNGRHIKGKKISIPLGGIACFEVDPTELEAVNKVVRLLREIKAGEKQAALDGSTFGKIIETFNVNSEFNAPIYIALAPILVSDESLREQVKLALDQTKLDIATTHKLGRFRAMVQAGIISKDSDIYSRVAQEFKVPMSGGHVQDFIEPKNWIKHALKSGLFEASDENFVQFWEMMSDHYFVNKYFTSSVLEALRETGILERELSRTSLYFDTLDLSKENGLGILKSFAASGVLPDSVQQRSSFRLEAQSMLPTKGPIFE